MNFDKTKFLSELKLDVANAILKRDAHNPNNARDVIIYHICKDEAEYAQSIIDAIERGDYDGVLESQALNDLEIQIGCSKMLFDDHNPDQIEEAYLELNDEIIRFIKFLRSES